MSTQHALAVVDEAGHIVAYILIESVGLNAGRIIVRDGNRTPLAFTTIALRSPAGVIASTPEAFWGPDLS